MLSKFEVNPTRRVHVTPTPVTLQPRWFPCAMKTLCKSPHMVFRMSGLCHPLDLMSWLSVPCPLCSSPQGLYVSGKYQAYSCFSLRSSCSLDLECVSFRSSYVRLFSLFSYHIKCRLFRETVETLLSARQWNTSDSHHWNSWGPALLFPYLWKLSHGHMTWMQPIVPDPGFQISRDRHTGAEAVFRPLWCHESPVEHFQYLRSVELILMMAPGSGAISSGPGTSVWGALQTTGSVYLRCALLPLGPMKTGSAAEVSVPLATWNSSAKRLFSLR